MTLLGYSQHCAPSTQHFILTTYWRVDSIEGPRDDWFFAPFAQAFDDQWRPDRCRRGRDGPRQAGDEWRATWAMCMCIN